MFGLPNWRSLQTRIAAGMLVVVLGILWVAEYSLSQSLRRDMEAAISAQQYSTVSLIAKEIDRSIVERLSIAESLAESLTSGVLAFPAATQRLIEERKIPGRIFNWGIIVTDSTGTAIASVPTDLHRTGTNYKEYDFIAKALSTGDVQLPDPVISPNSGLPVFTMVVPIIDDNQHTIGLVIGVTNLAQSNFLDEIGLAKYGNTGDFLVTAPVGRLYVASSDKRRVMKSGPARGVNPVYDRYIDGYEGSGIAKSSRGVVEMSSSRRIPTTGWLMQSVLPVDEAFAPIEAMERHLIVVSLVLTLVATLISWWWLHLQLRPLSEASTLLRNMREGVIPRQALPVVRPDEIGLLTEAFNGLQATIIDEESRAAEHTANRRLRHIVSFVPGMLFQYRLHADGRSDFPFVSEGIREIYGIAPEEAEGNASLLLDTMHADDREAFLASRNESARTLEPWNADYRIVLPDGQSRWLMITAQPERVGAGETFWHGFITDISERKAMAAELEQYRDHLEHLVEIRTADLEAARAEAERLAGVKSEFLANMSHEIRTPLHGMLGLAHIGKRNTDDDSKAHRTFDKILHSGNLLLGIINDILDFSKMEAGMLKIESAPVDLAAVLSESLELMQERADAKKLPLALITADDLPPTCRSDALRLRQILLNLLSNAVKFTEQGSVSLEAKFAGQQLVFRVIDTGIGIPAEQRDSIFHPFEQGDSSTTRRFGGTGLGLAITARLVELMGGSISVDSTPGQGSCFEVRLPYVAVSPSVATLSHDDSGQQHQTLTEIHQ
ncbi:ATP-binding protein [Dechloromonas sp. XY25]|uniref:histidine kinase n=1 Tax=Dechloromonas hankyongensis TaxID=2908002 RepID=A0ABS9K3G2_9RHOO|nr:ATP-binding protein [Dechloromonas hankyongensis]MCG2577717.1 ATP-binding protein [Dechloromonas hankyongensis]